MNALITLAAVLALSIPAAAEAVPANLTGPSMKALEAAVVSPAAMALVVDGGVPRKDGPVTIIAEDPFEERNYHPAREYDTVRTVYDDVWYDNYHGPIDHHGRRHDYGWHDRDCYGRHSHRFPRTIVEHHYEGAYTEVRTGTRQTVHIDDRSSYVRGHMMKGGLIGGLVGGLLGILGGPIGIVAGLALGAAVGAGVGYLMGSGKPETYTRDVNVNTRYER